MANVPLPGPRLRIALHRSTLFLFSRQARSIILLPRSSLKEDYIPENKGGPLLINPLGGPAENIRFFLFSLYISFSPKQRYTDYTTS